MDVSNDLFQVGVGRNVAAMVATLKDVAHAVVFSIESPGVFDSEIADGLEHRIA